MKPLETILIALALCVLADAHPPTVQYSLTNVRNTGPDQYLADWTPEPVISSDKPATILVTVRTFECLTMATGGSANLVIQPLYNRIYFEDGTSCHVKDAHIEEPKL
jgi:hypothetical protein